MKMRWVLVTALLLLIVPIALADVNLNREMPSATEVQNVINVSLEFRSTDQLEAFDIVEFIPLGWEVSDWAVHNYNKNRVILETQESYTYQSKARTAYHWSFRDGLGDLPVLLVYTLKAETTGSQEFISVWTYPGGFETSTSIMSVLPSEGVIFCGNEICELGETSFTCPEDCPRIDFEVYDLTWTLIILIIAIAAVIIAYIYTKYLKRMLKRKATIEDIRSYLKLGLKRGYTLREMINALKGEGVDEKMLEAIIADNVLKDMEIGNRKLRPEEEVIEKIKEVVDEITEEDKDQIYEELGVKRMRREPTKKVKKSKKGNKR